MEATEWKRPLQARVAGAELEVSSKEGVEEGVASLPEGHRAGDPLGFGPERWTQVLQM